MNIGEEFSFTFWSDAAQDRALVREGVSQFIRSNDISENS